MLWQPLNLTQSCQNHTQFTICSSLGYLYLDLLVRLFGDSKDRRIQEKLGIEDREDRILENIEKYSKRDEYDFIVVGAGSSGCVVANRLSANKKWKVLLLEAGIEQPDATLVPSLARTLIGSNIDWGYYTEPDEGSCLARPGGRCYWPRGKMMGGTSSMNGMVYMRGNRVDYDGWAALGNEGWSYKEVLPFFKKSENNIDPEGLNRKYHGVDGELTVSRFPYTDEPSVMLLNAINEQGLPIIDVNAERQDGVMHTQATSKGGQRDSTNTAFIQAIRYKRKNLTVRIKSEVIKILINENNVAYGVKYVKNGKVYTAFAKKEIIVSGGVINSPKLLMLSGIGPKEHLLKLNIPVIKDLAVGENLHDHVSFGGLPLSISNDSATLITPEEIFDALEDYSETRQKRGPLAGHGLASTSGFLRSDSKLPAPDVQIQFFGVILQEYLKNTIAYDAIRLFPSAYYDGIVPAPILLSPKSRGRLMLNATNPHGPPLIYANYFGDPDDVMPIVKVTRNFLLSLEKTKTFKSNGAHFVKTPMPACKDHPWGSEEYFICLARRHTQSYCHPVGTCKMGPKQDKKAVVDPRLRVYGISSLRVIDASIMPVIPRANTNAPCIMVGERGASFIIEDWLKKNH